MKALAILRVSTETQRIDEQKEELIAFLKGQGYDEIIPLEAVGASAIKVDDKYLELVDKVKNAIIGDKEIKAAGVWELSRLGRNEVILFQFKEFFISHNIQFICKQPYMKLLEEDGSVNAGMELAFSLYATMSKQEMAEKKARFKRTKKAMAIKGQYIGGHIIPYGYRVDKEGFYEENPEEANVVRLAFQLYSTGKYSTYTLSKELEERGIYLKDYKLCRMLRSKTYIGEATGEYQTRFPSIVSQELFEEVSKVRGNNRIDMKKKGIALGAKLIKCYKCGAVCTSNTKHYVCCKHSHRGPCDNGFALRARVADELLWRVAQAQHLQYLTDLNQNKVEQYLQELGVVDEKINAGLEKLKIIQGKKDRIAENYEDGLISKKTRDLRLLKVQDEVRAHQEYLSSLQGKREAIAGLLEGGNPDSVEAFLAALDTMDSESKFDIIHKHIKSLTAEPISFGVRDPRTHKPNGVKIIVTTILDTTEEFVYVPKLYQGFNLYVRNRNRWVPDMYLI